MIFLGIDVGSLTAKAALYDSSKNSLLDTFIMPVKATAHASSDAVIAALCEKTKVRKENINGVCATGYGRFECSLPAIEKSEISCHGMGAFWSNNAVRAIIDIGGQDSKAIAVDNGGMVVNFVMNDKCAAGTGRVLEVLAAAMDCSLTEMANAALKGKGKVSISNRCSVFMEQDVLLLQRAGHSKKEISYAINDAVADRVKALAKIVGVKSGVSLAITGGVSKNAAIVSLLEKKLDCSCIKLNHDPQLMGAIGAAIFAARNAEAAQ